MQQPGPSSSLPILHRHFLGDYLFTAVFWGATFFRGGCFGSFRLGNCSSTCLNAGSVPMSNRACSELCSANPVATGKAHRPEGFSGIFAVGSPGQKIVPGVSFPESRFPTRVSGIEIPGIEAGMLQTVFSPKKVVPLPGCGRAARSTVLRARFIAQTEVLQRRQSTHSPPLMCRCEAILRPVGCRIPKVCPWSCAG